MTLASSCSTTHKYRQKIDGKEEKKAKLVEKSRIEKERKEKERTSIEIIIDDIKCIEEKPEIA